MCCTLCSAPIIRTLLHRSFIPVQMCNLVWGQAVRDINQYQPYTDISKPAVNGTNGIANRLATKINPAYNHIKQGPLAYLTPIRLYFGLQLYSGFFQGGGALKTHRGKYAFPLIVYISILIFLLLQQQLHLGEQLRKKMQIHFRKTGKAQPVICPHRFLKNCRFYNYTGSQPSNLQQIY